MTTLELPTKFEEVVHADRGIDGYLPVTQETPESGIYFRLSVGHTAGHGYSLTLWRALKDNFGFTVSIFDDSKKIAELDALTQGYSKRFNRNNLNKLFDEATKAVFEDLSTHIEWAAKKKIG